MALDTYGRKIDEFYTIMSDPTFERRLKDFDSRLKLMYDQQSKRWVILEWAYDDSGWNIILKCEDRDGNPKPLGDWVFNKLFVFRQAWIEKMEKGPEKWLSDMEAQAEEIKKEQEQKLSVKNQEMILDDITEWKKAAREFDGGCPSDVTAGYQHTRNN
jgi:hypothetical protein